VERDQFFAFGDQFGEEILIAGEVSGRRGKSIFRNSA
jgi:hypothetical protein